MRRAPSGEGRGGGLALLLAGLLSLPALADPTDDIHSPVVTSGERAIGFLLGTFENRDGSGRDTVGSVSFGYGVNRWWSTDLTVKHGKLAGADERFGSVQWGNTVQLSGHAEGDAKAALATGLLFEVEVPRRHRDVGYVGKVGFLLEGDAGPVRWNASAVLERLFSGRLGDERLTRLGYELQAVHSTGRAFEFGLQAFGDFGQWNRWESGRLQRHNLGPAAFGETRLGDGQSLAYSVAFLFPATSTSPRNWLRLQLAYTF